MLFGYWSNMSFVLTTPTTSNWTPLCDFNLLDSDAFSSVSLFIWLNLWDFLFLRMAKGSFSLISDPFSSWFPIMSVGAPLVRFVNKQIWVKLVKVKSCLKAEDDHSHQHRSWEIRARHVVWLCRRTHSLAAVASFHLLAATALHSVLTLPTLSFRQNMTLTGCGWELSSSSQQARRG